MKKELKIDVLMPSTSQYEVLHHFARELYKSFVKQGISCRLLSGDDRIHATLNAPPSFTIGFNGAIKMEDGSLFCDHIQVPHIACLVDPPFRFLELTKSPLVLITCDDQVGCELLKKREFNQTCFMPHAVGSELNFDPDVPRIYDIVFLGTCIDGEHRRKNWRQVFSKKVLTFMEEACEATFQDETTSFISVLLKNLDPRDYQHAYEEVEMYVKAIDRLKLISAFPNQKVHVFGGSIDDTPWKALLKKQPNIKIHPPVAYDDAIEIMKQSKIVLNSSIKNKLGAHERIFTASACGAVVVTNDNPYIRKHFKPGKEILLYDHLGLEKTAQDVNQLLADENHRLEVAQAGRKKVMKNHTWDVRVKDLLNDLKHFHVK